MNKDRITPEEHKEFYQVSIDCGVCVPECPIDAIQADTVEGSEFWVEMNQKYALEWPRITLKGEPPMDADDWKDVPHKFPNHFSPKPGDS